MKIKAIVFTLVMALAAMLGMTACEDNVKPEHEHSYTEVAEKPSTCIETGVGAHLKCDGCGKLFVKEGDEYVETTEQALVLSLAQHSFAGEITIKANPTKTVYTAFETVDLTGIEVVKNCSVTGCEGEVVDAEDITFRYVTDQATCLTADMTKVIVKVGDSETELAVTVNKVEVQLPVISSKEYTGSVLVADVPASELYTVTENNGGTEVGSYQVKLALVDPTNYAFVGSGDEATVQFDVTKATNTITMPDNISNIKCYETPTVGATALEDATITYIYATGEDGEYGAMPLDGFAAGTYYVKAVASETASYAQTISDSKSFVVEHAFAGWVYTDANVDTGVCACGESLSDITFNKVVTDARQDVLLTADTKAITLGGISDYQSVKSVKYGELSLGSEISSLTIPEEINDLPHGEQLLSVIVTDEHGLDHAIEVPVTIITESISTWARMSEIAKTLNGTNETALTKTYEGKYFILANDIDVSSNTYSNERAWYSAGAGFAGTLDGRGHAFNNGRMYGGGLFGGLEGATIKNVKFINVENGGDNRTLLAGTIRNATLEQIEISSQSKIDISGTASYYGVIASHDIENVTMKNVTINMPNVSLPRIIGKHPRNTINKMPVCENVVVNAKYLNCIAETNDVKIALNAIPGLVVKMSESVTLGDDKAIDPLNIILAELVYDLKSAHQMLNVKQVLKGSEVISSDLYSVEGEEGAKYFYIGDLSDIVTPADYNTTITFTIVFDGGEGSDIRVNVSVKVLGLERQVALSSRQDVVLKDSTGARTTVTLDLGDYADWMVTKITYGQDVEFTEIAGSTVTIPEGLINGTHGEQNFVVFATKDNASFRITVPVTVITEEISDWATLLYNCNYNSHTSANGATVFGAGKYYTLGADFDGGACDKFTYNGTQYTAEWGSYGKGFAGTLDGRGHTISKVYNNNSIFSALKGATIKNVNITVSEYKDWTNNGLFASNIMDTTIENVTITFTAAVNLTKTPIIAGQHLFNSKLTNVTIHAEGCELAILLGTGSHADNSNNVCTSVKVYAKSLAKISPNSTEKEGVTFYPDEATTA